MFVFMSVDHGIIHACHDVSLFMGRLKMNVRNDHSRDSDSAQQSLASDLLLACFVILRRLTTKSKDLLIDETRAYCGFEERVEPHSILFLPCFIFRRDKMYNSSSR